MTKSGSIQSRKETQTQPSLHSRCATLSIPYHPCLRLGYDSDYRCYKDFRWSRFILLHCLHSSIRCKSQVPTSSFSISAAFPNLKSFWFPHPSLSTQSHRSSHRYSTFSALRSALVSLYPTIIIPPIPDKHTWTDHAAKGVGVGLSKSKDDVELVKRRRRMLQSFLRRCSKHEVLKMDSCFLRFLEGRMSWVSD